MTDAKFSLFADFDRKLIWEGGASVRYLVARMTACRPDDPTPMERAPVNIALVIDASGSMSGGKLKAAKSAALGLVEHLSSQDRLTVVSFASDVRVHLDAVQVSEENLAKIHAEIDRLVTRGMTCLSGGWFAGVDCAALVAEEDPRMTPRVVLLSDGHANQGITDYEELFEHADELRKRGVLTSALGIGDGYDENLLRGLAENGGGRLHDAEFASEISSVLLGELEDIFGIVVEDTELAVDVPEGVDIEFLGRGYTEHERGRTVVHLGALQNGIDRFAVFKITCPRVSRGSQLRFKVSAKGMDAKTSASVSAGPARIELVSEIGFRNSGQARNEELAGIVARHWSAHVVSTAAVMNRDGAHNDAQRYVEDELRYFRRYAEGLNGGPELIRDLKLLAERSRQRFSPRMRKEMIVQSALMAENRIDRRGAGKSSWSDRMRGGD